MSSGDLNVAITANLNIPDEFQDHSMHHTLSKPQDNNTEVT